MEQFEEQIKELEEQSEELQAYRRNLERLANYNGPDRVIGVLEASELYKDEDAILAQTKISGLDNLIGGFIGGQLIILSGPTGHGKTSFSQFLTEKFFEQKIDVLWFSYEVGFSEFIKKFAFLPVFYLPRKIKQNNLLWLEERILESVAKFNCKIVFIDHLHYLLEMAKMAQAKSLSLLVGMMLRELKRIAIENNICIFLISHMRKLYYTQEPDIDDLRDSSFTGQEADLVMFIFRVAVNKELTNQTIVKVAKNRRTGNLGKVALTYSDNQYYE